MKGGEERARPPHCIRDWRKFRRLTIEQLAERADLSVSTVSDVETGKQDFTGATLLAIAVALGTKVAALFSLPSANDTKEDLYTALEDMRPADRRRIEAIIQALKDTGTDL